MNTQLSQKEKIANDIENECKRLRELGYSVVLSYKNKKRPIGSSWTESINTPCDGYKHNIGLICTNMLVIDIDRTGEMDSNAEIIKIVLNRAFQETRGSTTRTPTGGYHLYLKTDKVIQSINKTQDWNFTYLGKTYKVPIDIKSEGGFVVIAPSTYPYDEETTPEHNKWKAVYKGIPYNAEVPIGEQTNTASPELIKFIEERRSFNVDAYGNIVYDDDEASTDSEW